MGRKKIILTKFSDFVKLPEISLKIYFVYLWTFGDLRNQLTSKECSPKTIKTSTTSFNVLRDICGHHCSVRTFRQVVTLNSKQLYLSSVLRVNRKLNNLNIYQRPNKIQRDELSLK